MKEYLDKFREYKERFLNDWSYERKKSIIMLGIMLVFFTLVILGLDGKGNKTEKIDNSTTNYFQFNLSKINNGNYHFIYDILIDNNKASYVGDCYNNRNVLSDGANNYFRYKDVFLKEYNGLWARYNKPIIYDEFTEIDNIILLLRKSSFDKKEEYSDKKVVYNYNISTPTIVEIIENKNIDIDDNVNKIKVTTDKDNNVEMIDLDLSSYGKYKNYGNSITVNLKYSDFEKIEKIEIPE